MSKTKRTPGAEYRRWLKEMDAAEKRVKRWHQQGKRIQARFQDRRGMQGASNYEVDNDLMRTKAFRVNLFNSNIVTLKSMLTGNPPKVDVSRRYADADDDQARVASLMLGRMLNNDFCTACEDTTQTFEHNLEDRLLPGFAVARVRYEFSKKDEVVPAIEDEDGEELAASYTKSVLQTESAPIDYVHWDDFRWGFARTWSEVPWIAFRSYMNKSEVKERFGEEAADQLTYGKANQQSRINDMRLTSDEMAEAGQRAEVWEIWEKSSRQVYWWARNYEKVLDQEDDTLELSGFWPCARPWIANQVTNVFLPQPDFSIAQDLYNEIDQLETRIGIITSAVRVVGLYDKANDGIKRMLQEGVENDLIPIDNWAAFAEKGGIEGAVSWLPIKEITEALDKLVQMRSDAMALLYEVTGMAEIMRGANGPDRETADASNNKKQFASVRVQALQADFAKFISQTLAIKAEVISRHFEEKTIVEESNILMTPDGQDQAAVQAALQLIKQPSETAWKIKVEPESMAMVDYQSMKADRMGFIEALGSLINSSAPLIEQSPNSMPFIMKVVQWAMASFKGSNEIEGVLDRAIKEMSKPQAQEQKPSDEQIKAQAQREKMQHEKEMEDQKTQNEAKLETQKFQDNMREMMQEFKNSLALMQQEAARNTQVEAAQSTAAVEQTRQEGAIEDQLAERQLIRDKELEADKAKHAKEIDTHEAGNAKRVDTHETKNAMKVKKVEAKTNGSKNV
jgi:hypothetical protein